MPSTLGIVSSHLTRRASTSLLLNGDFTPVGTNTFVDSSSNNFTVTRNGNSVQGSVSPFPITPGTLYDPAINGGSVYFGGASSDFLSINKGSAWLSRSADWTLECWFNKTANTGSWGGFSSACLASTNTGSNGFEFNILGSGAGSSISFVFKNSPGVSALFSFALNKWYHTAVVKEGSKLMLFLDGVKLAENTSLSNWTDLNVLSIGRLSYSPYFYAFPGYISSFRVSNTALYTADFARPTAPLTTTSNGGGGGTAPTSSQVSLLLNFTNGRVIDSTGKNNLTPVGNATISSSIKKYGAGSLAFDGNGDYLQLPRLLDSTEDVTIEAWIYPLSDPAGKYIAAQYVFGGADRTIFSAVGMQIGSVAPSQTMSPPLNQWSHVAWVRRGNSTNNWTHYLNGVASGTMTYTGTYQNTPLTIGASPNYSGSEFNGYIDDLRITKGFAIYKEPFPSNLPTGPLTYEVYSAS